MSAGLAIKTGMAAVKPSTVLKAAGAIMTSVKMTVGAVGSLAKAAATSATKVTKPALFTTKYVKPGASASKFTQVRQALDKSGTNKFLRRAFVGGMTVFGIGAYAFNRNMYYKDQENMKQQMVNQLLISTRNSYVSNLEVSKSYLNAMIQAANKLDPRSVEYSSLQEQIRRMRQGIDEQEQQIVNLVENEQPYVSTDRYDAWRELGDAFKPR